MKQFFPLFSSTNFVISFFLCIFHLSISLYISFPLHFNFHSHLSEVFPCFSSVVWQMPRYNSQRPGTARTLPHLIVLFCVLFVCKCVMSYCHQVSNPIAVNKYIYIYVSRSESKERFAIQRYLLIIGKKHNMQILSHTFTYFST